MDKWFKIIPMITLVFFLSLYILNLMPILKSNCGCDFQEKGETVRRVPLNYFVGCFCSEAQVEHDNFPTWLKSNFAQGTLLIIPFLIAAITLFILKNKFR